MKQCVVRFVPEHTKNDLFLDQFLAISKDLNFKFSRGVGGGGGWIHPSWLTLARSH